jgi:hypothetical protein
MPERLKTQSYEDRASSKIGVWDYFTKHVTWVLAPFAGMGVGHVLRRATKLSLLEGMSMIAGLKRGEAWGLGLGSMLAAYHLWKNNTTEQLQVDEIARDVEALRAMESSNSYLRRENEQLQRQLRFGEAGHKPATSHASQVSERRESLDAAAQR